MSKYKNTNTIVIIVLALILIAGFFVFNTQSKEEDNNQAPTETEMLLFTSIGCPHCENVKEYINENNIKEKYTFKELEISQNQVNNKRFLEKASDCGLSPQNLGVPFLWTGTDCLMGDIAIIDFFSK